MADPIVEDANVSTSSERVVDAAESRIEIHLKPGVMDPVASSTEMAIRDMGLPVRQVRTGRAYLIEVSQVGGLLKACARRVQDVLRNVVQWMIGRGLDCEIDVNGTRGRVRPTVPLSDAGVPSCLIVGLGSVA